LSQSVRWARGRILGVLLFSETYDWSLRCNRESSSDLARTL